MSRSEQPRVFVSYAWEDKDYKTWVKRLAKRLRADGVNARLDAWHLDGRPFGDFMTAEVEDADWVLLVCSPKYREKVKAMQSGQRPTGSGWELSLLTSAILDAEGPKVALALGRGERRRSIPFGFKGRECHDLTDAATLEENYRSLLQELLGATERAPGVGTKPLNLRDPEIEPMRAPAPASAAGEAASTGQNSDSRRPASPAPEVSISAPTPRPTPARKPEEVPGTSFGRRFFWGVSIGLLGVLATALAWCYPRPPSGSVAPDEPSLPALYAMRVQVLDPSGLPVSGSKLRLSSGSEPQLLPDGWWEIEIPQVKIPLDRRVTLWAEHHEWRTARKVVELGEDSNPSVEILLKVPREKISGVVVGPEGRAVEGARLSLQNFEGPTVLSNRDGQFELWVIAAQDQLAHFQIEHPEFPAQDGSCFVGRSNCDLVLEPK